MNSLKDSVLGASSYQIVSISRPGTAVRAPVSNSVGATSQLVSSLSCNLSCNSGCLHNFVSHNGHSLSILYYNARSLVCNIDNLRANCLLHDPDIVCIVESWLDSDIENSELHISGCIQMRRHSNCNISSK